MNEKELIEELCGWLGSGRLDPGFVLPAIRDLSRQAPARRPVWELLETLQAHPGEAYASLATHLRAKRRAEAARCHHKKKAGGDLAEFRPMLGDLPLEIPVDWSTGPDRLGALREALGLLRQRLSGGGPAGDPQLKDALARACELLDPVLLIEKLGARADAAPLLPALGGLKPRILDAETAAHRAAKDCLWGRGSEFPVEVTEDASTGLMLEAFAAGSPEQRRRVLDVACSWPTSRVAEVIRAIGERDPALRERAMLLLALRHREAATQDWSSCASWLERVRQKDEAALVELRALVSEAPAELLLLWLEGGAPAPDELRRTLADYCCAYRGAAEPAAPARPAPLPPRPLGALRPKLAEPRVGAAEPRAGAAEPRAGAAEPPPPPAPPEPSLWDQHILPLFANNWTMLTGIAMVVVGSSLLAYYTWDKHWFFRYTVLPLLLAAFTAALARAASWMEERDRALKTTSDMLRGAAIALLPANFMAVALLAHDPQVTGKAVLLPAYALAYLAVGGYGLARWCAAVHPSLRGVLGGSLLAINALVLLGPFAQLLDPSGEWVRLWMGLGFYAGFALGCAALARFLAVDLTPKMIEDGRVPWFFGIALTTTFLQVFLWVHSFMRLMPQVHTYACMVIAAGGLVLFTERTPLVRHKDEPVYGKNSFLGYAFILLGLFMGASQPQVRSLSLALAGSVWLAQAVLRADLLHAWIAFTLLALGGGSVATWEAFPGASTPTLVFGLAIGVEAAGLVARRWWHELASVSAGMQALLLNVATAVAVLAQWHYGFAPLGAAALLLLNAALLARRARADGKLAYVHAAALTLAIALPYLGCADMSGRTLHGNTLVFGLGALSIGWLALTRLRPTPLILSARSAVLVTYGLFATAAIALKVAFEQGRPEDLQPLQAALSFAGPPLIGVSLVAATYFSRSWVPLGLASVIGFVLAPELKAEIQSMLPFIEWGSGLMSGAWALALVLACFPLRSSPLLAGLDEGDDFMPGSPFPLKRKDYTLFTTPLLASAVFLALKVDTWSLERVLVTEGSHLRTAAGLVLAGAAWVLLAVYLREKEQAPKLGLLGLASAGAGLVVAYYGLAPGACWQNAVACLGCGATGLFLLYRYGLAPSAPWARELLAAPARDALRGASVFICLAVLLSLVAGGSVGVDLPLILFSTALLAWFGLTDGEPVYGTLLSLQSGTVLLAWAAGPTADFLFMRVSIETCATPMLLFGLALLGAELLLEAAPDAERSARKLLEPVYFWVAVAALAAGAAGILDGATAGRLSEPQRWLLIAFLLGSARAQACGPLALLGLTLGYVEVLCGPLPAGGWEGRAEILLSPAMAASFALALAAQAEVGAFVHERWPRLVEGPYATPFLRACALPWLHGAALALGACAVLRHGGEPALRGAALQLPAPFLAAGAYVIVGSRWRQAAVFYLSALFVTIGNVLAVRLFAGDALRAQGMMNNHLVCLGAVASLVEARALGAALEAGAARAFLDRVGLLLAGFVLALLASTYLSHPDLERVTSLRFLVSGAIAFIAGRRFQRAAREPGPGEEAYVEVWEGAYHFALVTALWCFALLCPWLRTPYAAFPALGLPVLYFYLRAEIGRPPCGPIDGRHSGACAPLGRPPCGPIDGRHSGACAPLGAPSDVRTARYRDTAAALSFFLLALYVFRGAFQAVLFPGAPVGLEHYHFNSPFVLVLGLLMARLHALGGTPWLAYYSGPALMAGSYFALTWLPGLSPFEHPIGAAGCAIGLGHFWMLFSGQPSPALNAMRRFAGIDEASWERSRRSWGVVLLLSTQAAVLYGVFLPHDAFWVGPLLAGGATLLAHQSWLRRSRLLYYWTLLEWLAALQASAMFGGWIPAGALVWTVVGTWAAALAAAEVWRDGLAGAEIERTSLLLGIVVGLHVMSLGWGSPEGMAAFACGAVLLGVTPRGSREPGSTGERLLACALLASPAWLVLSAQLWGDGLRTLLATAAALLATGAAAGLAERRGWHLRAVEGRPRAWHQVLWVAGTQGRAIALGLLMVATAGALWGQCAHYGSALSPANLTLLLGLYAGCAASWWLEAREASFPIAPSKAGTAGLAPRQRVSMGAYVLAQLCAFGLLAAARRQVMLTWGQWSYEYDVWASLLVSCAVAGARQAGPEAPRELRVPMIGTLFMMPAAALAWVAFRGLGTDTALLIVGLNSLLFAYMGRRDSESPYRVVAMAGLVSFICIVFWSKLQLRVAQAYVIPAGAGVLVLVQMFRDKIAPDVRNQIRAATLLAMLGSAGYYALADDRYPLAFHTTMLVVSVFAMAAGSALQVRLYVLLGFAGLGTDLAALVYKVLVHMDRSTRMTLVGSQVLIFGTIMIGGAVVYKTHQREIDARIDRLRQRLLSWE